MPINDGWMDRGEDPNVVAQQYEDQIEQLEAELAAVRKQLAVCQERRESELKRLDEVGLTATLQAVEIGDLRPWAEVGKQAVRENWYLATRNMLCCRRWYGDGHAPDCLLAQLKADIQEAMAPLVNEVMNEWEPQDE